MDLQQHYQQMYHRSAQAIREGCYRTDGLIDSPSDGRLGLTLRLLAGEALHVAAFLQQVQQVEPRQYYYPATDLHVTALSIISCFEGFDLPATDVDAYVRVMEPALAGIEPFAIEFRGLTAAADAVMVCGYPGDAMLEQLRHQLRAAFRSSGLFHTIDSRYPIVTAHATLIRFREPLADPEALLRLLEHYKEDAFGTLHVDSVQLVANDWYHRRGRVKLLHTFALTKRAR